MFVSEAKLGERCLLSEQRLRSAHSNRSKWDSDSSEAVVWQAGGIDPIP
jgi:hypothetical protein